MQDFPDNSISREDRMVRLNSVFRPFIDVNRARLLAAAGADHLRGGGLGDELLFEREQQLQAAWLLSIFGVTNLLQSYGLDLLLEVAFLVAYTAQIYVVMRDARG